MDEMSGPCPGELCLPIMLRWHVDEPYILKNILQALNAPVANNVVEQVRNAYDDILPGLPYPELPVVALCSTPPRTCASATLLCIFKHRHKLRTGREHHKSTEKLRGRRLHECCRSASSSGSTATATASISCKMLECDEYDEGTRHRLRRPKW